MSPGARSGHRLRLCLALPNGPCGALLHGSPYTGAVSATRKTKLPDRMLRRVLQLVAGLALFGLGVSLILRSNLGAASWDVLTQGLSYHLPLSFGTITIIISGLVLLCWIPLRQRVGVGTIANAVLVGVFADVGLALFQTPEVFWVQLLTMLLGVTIVGVASGLYIGAGFGSGPRDGLMIGLHTITGLPIWLVRTALEITVVVVGWLLGGTVGIGTVAFALLIGPLCQVFLPLFAIKGSEHGETAVDPALEAPVVVAEPAFAPVDTGTIPVVAPGATEGASAGEGVPADEVAPAEGETAARTNVGTVSAVGHRAATHGPTLAE